MEYLAKEFDEDTNTWFDKLDIHVPNWGMTYPVRKQLDYVVRDVNSETKRGFDQDILNTAIKSISSATGYFERLIETLIKLGYVENKDIVSAPFDWRNEPNDEWMAKTKDQIEKTYANNNNTPVVLIAHSYGNIMTYLFLIKQTPEWKEKYIHHYAAVSPAYMGSPKSYILALTYTVLDYSPDAPLYLEAMGRPFRNVPSLYTLMPYSKAYRDDPNALEVPGRNYTFDEIPEIFNEVGIDNFDAKWNSTRSMMGELHGEEYSVEPGVNTTIFYTTSRKSTYYKVRCTKTLEELANYTDWVGSGLCEIVFKDGDGTITTEALIYPYKNWKAKEKGNRKYNLIDIKDVAHTSLLACDDFLKELGPIIDNNAIYDILKYDVSLADSAKLFGMYLGITFGLTLIAIFVFSFIAPIRFCPCSCKKNKCCCCGFAGSNAVRVLFTTVVLSVGTIALIAVSFFQDWMYVDYNNKVLHFKLSTYSLSGEKHDISSLEDCHSCGGIWNAGKYVFVFGCVVIVAMALMLILSVVSAIHKLCCKNRCCSKCDEDYSYENVKDQDMRNSPTHAICLGLGLISVVAIGATAIVYGVKASDLSDDKYSKSFTDGFPCYLASVIPAIGLTLMYALEVLISSKVAEVKEVEFSDEIVGSHNDNKKDYVYSSDDDDIDPVDYDEED